MRHLRGYVRTLLSTLLILAGALLAPAMIQAQTTTVLATAPTILDLTATPTSVDFGTLTLSDFLTGYAEKLNAQTLTIHANVPWTLTLKANAPTWTYSGTATDPNKPASDLLFQASSTDPHISTITSTYTSVDSLTGQQVATGTRGGNINLTMDFRVLLSLETDPPGDYSLTLTYTLSTP